jgi:DNA-binding phage protein
MISNEVSDKIIEQLRAVKKSRRLKYVARQTGIHSHTLYFLCSGRTTYPQEETLEKLAEFFNL